MTERKAAFVTTCPQCRGTTIANADHEMIRQSGSYFGREYRPTVNGAEPIPCPTCDSRGKVIAQVLAPFVVEETW